MTRFALLLTSVSAFLFAPFQCKMDDPARFRVESPGEALFQLCGDFAKKGDNDAARLTLQFILDHYPSSRFARRAQEEKQAEKPCHSVAAEFALQKEHKAARETARSSASSAVEKER